MNLINDAWIPVRRQSGVTEVIAPWQMTDRYEEDTIVRIASPRPDFDGALVQFLIGLLQTCFAPDSERGWRQRLTPPPSPDDLKAALSSVEAAFDLDGDGPRFMQDLTLEQDIVKEKLADATNDIGQLLLDIPGEKTLELNKDHFVKRGGIERLCQSCAATALFSLQTNAPSGGQGHRVGIRGGGPLTTLVLGDTLWELSWRNVLGKDEFLGLTGNTQKSTPVDHFPWMGKTRTSEPGGFKITPRDTHPVQVFWAMPRRIRMRFEEMPSHASCDICNSAASLCSRDYLTKNYGMNYSGPWLHPLSPYYTASDGSPQAKHPKDGGIGYRHWLGLIQNDSEGQSKARPARVVERYWDRRQENGRLWAFGYEMDNMKAVSWQESVMPLIFSQPGNRRDFENRVACIIRGADFIAKATQSQIKAAFFKKGVTVRGDLSYVSGRFWSDTEAAFYDHLTKVRDAIDSAQDPLLVLESWCRIITGTSERIFTELSQAGSFEACDPKRIAKAWNDLHKLHGKKLRETLELPVVNGPAASKKRGGKSRDKKAN